MVYTEFTSKVKILLNENNVKIVQC